MYHKTYTESDWIWHSSFRFVNVDMKQNRGWDPICSNGVWPRWAQFVKSRVISKAAAVDEHRFYPQKCVFDCLFLPSQQWATYSHRHAMASHRRYLVLWLNSACPELGLSTIWWRLWCIPRCGKAALWAPNSSTSLTLRAGYGNSEYYEADYGCAEEDRNAVKQVSLETTLNLRKRLPGLDIVVRYFMNIRSTHIRIWLWIHTVDVFGWTKLGGIWQHSLRCPALFPKDTPDGRRPRRRGGRRRKNKGLPVGS